MGDIYKNPDRIVGSLFHWSGTALPVPIDRGRLFPSPSSSGAERLWVGLLAMKLTCFFT